MNNTPFRVLFREFLLRLVDLELLAAKGDMSTLLGQIAALLIFLSLLFVMGAVQLASIPAQGVPPQVSLLLTWTGEHFLIATTMLVVGLFAVLSWDSTFPNKRDVFVLAPLPIPTRTLFLAKVAAVAVALSLTVMALHSLVGIAMPLALFSQARQASTPVLTYEAALPPLDVAHMQAVLERDLAPAQAPDGMLAPGTGVGAVVGIVRHGTRRVFAYGAVKPDSIFEIGSVSKTFTALILAQMAAQQQVSLQEPVRELLRSGTIARPLGLEITLETLATHHSGLPNFPDNVKPAENDNPFADYRATDLYVFVAKNGVALRPKTPFEYSSTGFGLLGVAMANRAGITFPELLRREVTGPLGMDDTVVTLTPEQRSRFAQAMRFANHPGHEWNLDALCGAGGIRSTAADMLTYLEAQLHPDKLTLSGDDASASLPAAIAESHIRRADAPGGNRIALGWMYIKDNAAYWHNGATGGFSSYALFHLKDDYAVVVLTNQGGLAGFAGLLGEHVRQRLAGEPALSLANVVVPSSRGFLGLMHIFAVYWIVMFMAGAFVFCFVLGLQGLAAQILPRRWFLRVSSFLQLAAFGGFLAGYILQPLAVTAGTVWAAQTHGPVYWSPSYWFLGLFQQLMGSPAMAPLANRAWIGMGVVFTLTITAYILSYLRTMRKIVEEPDIVSSTRGWSWLPDFGSGMTTAVTQFSVRALLRSRQHRMLLAFYWGIALAFVILLVKNPGVPVEDQWSQPSISWIVTSVMVMCAAIVGIRVVASLPLDIRANWIFQVMPLRSGRPNLAAVRCAFYMLAVVPVSSVFAALFLWLWPWLPAVEHLVVLGLLGIAVTELCLSGFHKIPFTCTYLPGSSRANMAFLAFIGMVALVVRGASLELRAFDDPREFVIIALVLGIPAILARWRTSATAGELRFEEEPEPAIFALDLHRDGTPPR